MALGVGLCNNGFMHHGNPPLPLRTASRGWGLSWNRGSGRGSDPWCISQGGETEAQREQMAGCRLPSCPWVGPGQMWGSVSLQTTRGLGQLMNPSFPSFVLH